jgi:hypothetical protein
MAGIAVEQPVGEVAAQGDPGRGRRVLRSARFGYGKGLNATRERTLVRNDTSGRWVGVAFGATRGSSEPRNAMIDRMSSSDTCASFTMYGGG